MSDTSVPIADGIAHLIYCSHVIEHLPDAAAVHLIEEAYRCLRGEGSHVDGAENPITDNELDEVFGTMAYEDALTLCTSRCNVAVQRKYPGNHISWWNGKKLMNALKKAGFSEVYLSGWGQSASPVLRDIRYFDTTRPKTSTFVEAIK